jgi:hypothetical protein
MILKVAAVVVSVAVLAVATLFGTNLLLRDTYALRTRRAAFAQQLRKLAVEHPECLAEGQICDANNTLGPLLGQASFAIHGQRVESPRGTWFDIPAELVQLSARGQLIAATGGWSSDEPDFWLVSQEHTFLLVQGEHVRRL